MFAVNLFNYTSSSARKDWLPGMENSPTMIVNGKKLIPLKEPSFLNF